MDDPRNVAEKGEHDIDPEVLADPDLQENPERRQEDGGDDAQKVHGEPPVFSGTIAADRKVTSWRIDMQRTLEPELMLDEAQALAYARADFEAPHQRVVEEFRAAFPGLDLDGDILDLGCGPGDITFRFAQAFPRARLIGVDGSPAMLALARQRGEAEGLAGRVAFVEGIIPGAPIPPLPWQAVVSNSLLHHLHRPEVLWQPIRSLAAAGTHLFIYDLRRPETPEQAREMVELYAAGEPEVLRRDFHHSLLAAFIVAEVEAQLVEAGLRGLTVRPIGDRHLAVQGILESLPAGNRK